MSKVMDKVQSITKRSWSDRTEGQQYSFADMTELLAFIQHEIMVSRVKYKDIAAKGHMSPSTVSNIASGQTRFPRAQTVFEVLRVLGFTVVVKS